MLQNFNFFPYIQHGDFPEVFQVFNNFVPASKKRLFTYHKDLI